MAEKKLTPEEQAELNNLLKERERIEKQISINVEKGANARHMEKKRLDELIKKGEEESKQLLKKINTLQKKKEYYEYEKGAYKSLSSISAKALKEIKGQAKSAGLIASVTRHTVDMKKKELTLEGKALQTSIARRTTLEELRNKVIQQGESLAKAHGHALTKEQQREKFEKSIAHLTQKQKEEARELNETYEKLTKKQERAHALQHQLHHVAHHLPEAITGAATGMVSFVKQVAKAGMAFGLLMVGVAVLGMALHAFMEMDAAAEDFRKETGLTVRQSKEMYDVAHHTAIEYRALGVGAKEALETIQELKGAQGDMFNFSQSTVDALSLMNTRLGIAAKDSAAVVSIFEQMGGLSESAATSAALQAANMSAKVGVSTKAVFADMAKSAATLSKHMRGNVELFVQQAVKARMLGTSLEGLTKTAEKLLDFENGIEEELVAATYVGGQFNLTRARALAYEGKIAEANEEILNQIQASGDFRKKDYFTQTQLAKAAGKSVEEITKELGVRDKLQSLNGQQLKNAEALIDKGVDISNLSDEEIQKQAKQLASQEKIAGVMSEIQDQIAGIVERIGGNFTPALQMAGDILVGILHVVNFLGEGFALMRENILAATVGATIFLGIMGLITLAKIKQLFLTKQNTKATTQEAAAEAGKATAGIFGSLAKIPFGVGLALAAGIVLGMMGLMKAFSKGDDVFSPGGSSGYGERTLMGPEGAIQLNNRDTVIAGTDLFKQDNQTRTTASPTPIAASNNRMISALIQEFRGVREDMASGKIGVYMDNEKVTANVGKTIDTSTRNKFALA